MAQVNYKLENKVFELTQHLTVKTEEAKALQKDKMTLEQQVISLFVFPEKKNETKSIRFNIGKKNITLKNY